MPIDVECQDCGKRLRLRDDLAGKRVRCPGCGEPLTVEAPEEDEPEERPAPRKNSVRPAAPARPAIKRPRDEDDDDEQPVRKRRRDDDEEEDDRPAARRRRDEDEDDERPARKRRRDDDEDDEDEDDRPRSRKKPKKAKGGGSPVPLILAIVAGVLLLVGGGAVGAFFLLQGGASANLLAFVPGDGAGFVSVRFAEALKTPAGQAMMEKGKAANPNQPIDDEFGVPLDQVARGTFVFREGAAALDNSYMVVETVGAYDREKIKARLAGAAEAEHEGKKYLVGTRQRAPGRWAVYFASSTLLVNGQEGAVKQAISISLKPRVAGPLDDGLALLSASRHVVGGFNPSPASMAQVRNMVANPSARQFAPLTEFQSGTVTMTVGSSLDLEASLKYPGDAQAAAAKGAADKGIAAGQVMVGAMKANVQPQDQAAFGAFETALNGIKVQQLGQRMVVTMKVDGITDAINRIPAMIPGGGMPGPNPGFPGPRR